MVKAGDLDRFVQFQRYTEADDGFRAEKQWADHGSRIPAAKTDISDAERWRAGEVSASITARFLVRWSSFSSDITPKDRLTCDGVTYEISGIKEVMGRREALEITTAARADQ